MSHYSCKKNIPADHILHSKYSPLLSQLLFNRNIVELSTAENFINPKYEDNHDPFLMHGITKAIERIHQAIQQDQKITIYSDYDADGIPGAVIIASLFEKIKYSNYDIYIPHRHDEGYGVHIPALEKIVESGSELIITIDTGITAYAAADWCKKKNIDLIITDHHLSGVDESGNEKLPDCHTLVNPKQLACNYPDPMLCGCGVMFKIIQAFLEKYREEFDIHIGWEKWLLDLVGISTISDLVPLQNENRIFAKYGIQVIKKTKNKGLKQLLWDAGISINYIGTEDIAFGITPKINAASRMSHPMDAVSVFLAKDEVGAKTRVKHLVSLNNERKKLTAKTMKEALEILEHSEIQDVIVVGAQHWKAGILGLVASKLVEKYKKPAFVWSQEHDEIKGSCRTWNNAHLVEIMRASDPDTFLQFGGHAEAAGFSVDPEKIDTLQAKLSTAFKKTRKKNTTTSKEKITVDRILGIDDINIRTNKEINQLAPFGMANEKPLFAWENVLPEHVGQFGKTKEHIEIQFANSKNEQIRAISFFKTPTDYIKIPTEQEPCTIIGHLEHSVFMGRHEVRIKIVEIV